MDFIEYPKALYKSGEYVAVDSKRQEKAKRADGWDDYLADRARTEGTPLPEAAPEEATPDAADESQPEA